MRTIVRRRHKLSVCGGLEEGLPSDLAEDPHGTVNLWADPGHRAVRADLLHELVSELARTDRLDVTRISGA